MSLDENTSVLIGTIYDAIDDRVAWANVLDTILDRTGSRFLLVSAVDLGVGQYRDTYWHGPDDASFLDGLQDYESTLYRDDPTLTFAIQNPCAGKINLRAALARAGRDPAGDPYARWVNDTLGAADSLVRYTAPTNGLTLGISLHASAEIGTHSPASTSLFLMLFEHIERALRLAVRPPDFTDDGKAAIMIGGDGRIIRANEAASLLLAARDGLAIAGDRLAAASAAPGKRLDSAIRSALGALTEGSAGSALALPRPSGRADLLVRVDPLPNPPSPFEAFRPAALVSITEPDANRVGQGETRLWAQTFGLTAAETRLTAAMLAGDGNLRCVAEQLGIAYATARVQLASVFDKVGVRSQAQMARLLTRIGG